MSDNLPAVVPVTPLQAVAKLPAISPEMYSHVGRYAGAVVMSVFEQIGGVDRMAIWADGSPNDFFTKVFPKMIQRSTAVEHSGTLTIDDAITRLERIEDADFEPVYDL